MIRPLNIENSKPKEVSKKENNEISNKYADNYPSWSLVPKNQFINRVKRNG